MVYTTESDPQQLEFPARCDHATARPPPCTSTPPAALILTTLHLILLRTPFDSTFSFLALRWRHAEHIQQIALTGVLAEPRVSNVQCRRWTCSSLQRSRAIFVVIGLHAPGITILLLRVHPSICEQTPLRSASAAYFRMARYDCNWFGTRGVSRWDIDVKNLLMTTTHVSSSRSNLIARRIRGTLASISQFTCTCPQLSMWLRLFGTPSRAICLHSLMDALPR